MSGGIASEPRRLGAGFWGFIVFMLVLTVLWVVLGIWQLERLQWKEGLIAEVNARLTAPPYDLPPASEWATTDTSTFEYHAVRMSGRYAAAEPVLVFTSLTDPKGKYRGAGYWIMTPFNPDGGGTVFINRGFVPQDSARAYLDDNTVLKGHMSLTGTMLPAEVAGPFTPAPDRPKHVDWIANAKRLAAFDGLSGPIFPLTMDLPAGPAGALPQGGETTVDFPNNHLGYAFTWFGLAILTPALLGYWIWRQLRPNARPPKSLPR